MSNTDVEINVLNESNVKSNIDKIDNNDNNKGKSSENDSKLSQSVSISSLKTNTKVNKPMSIDFITPSTLLTPCPSPCNVPEFAKRFHRVVLTGGPCAGKTTSINRIKNFFENIGWKVFIVPETATILLGSGIHFYDLGKHTITFQENLLKTLLQIEDSINETVKFHFTEKDQSCLVIYDRGAMDPVAYLNEDDWETLKLRNPTWNEVDLRDNRYDQIIHMITAANGAEQFYMLDNNLTRTEGIEVARQIDEKCAKTWVGHPYIDVIDNCTEFDMKVSRVLQAVCQRIGLQFDGYELGNRKRKFLIKSCPESKKFPGFQDFNVVHNYLVSNSPNVQARIRKRGQSNVWSYTYTVRTHQGDQIVETRRQIDKREYNMLLKTIDPNHYTIYKIRRCFKWNNRYFQLDTYEEPCKPSCRGLSILSTHCMDQDVILPDFLQIEKDITNDPYYSMFNLSHKDQNSS